MIIKPRLSSGVWSVAVGICTRSAKRALMRPGAAAWQEGPVFQFIPKEGAQWGRGQGSVQEFFQHA